MKHLVMMILTAMSLVAFTGCDRNDRGGRDLGREIERGAEDVGEGAEDAAEDIEDGVEDATD